MASQDVDNSSSELPLQEGDERLTPDQLGRLEIFRSVQQPPDFKEHRDATVLRRYQKGDVVCRQGETGQTAFYILRSEDVLALKNRQLDDVRYEHNRTDNKHNLHEQIQEIKNEISIFKSRVADMPSKDDDPSSSRQAASAHLLTGQSKQARPKGALGRLNKAARGGTAASLAPPEFVPNDGPVDINYQSKKAPLFEGDIFGEMSCMTGSARSATVVADADCYMLELTWPIYDPLQRDPVYRRRADKTYRERILLGHLQRLPILKDLTESELNFIRERARLEIVDPGEVICDENDPADAAYLIRGGLVQVLAGLNLTLKPEDISDWQSFCKELMAGNT